MFAQAPKDAPLRRILVLHENPILRTWEQNYLQSLWSDSLFVNTPSMIGIQYEALNLNQGISDSTIALRIRERFAQDHFSLVIGLLPRTCHFLNAFDSLLWPQTPILYIAPSVSDVPAIRTRKKNRAVSSQVTNSIQQTLQDIVHIYPELQELIVATGSSPADSFYLKIIRENLASQPIQAKITFWTGIPLADLEARAQVLDSRNTAVLLGSYDQDLIGNHYNLTRLTSRLSRASRAPVFSFFDSPSGFGILGGTMSRAQDYARLSWRVFFEQDANFSGDVQVSKVYSWSQMQRYGIEPGQLPAGSHIEGSPRSLWRKYPVGIIAAIVALAALLLLSSRLFLIVRHLRKTERSLRHSEQLFETVFQTAPLSLFLIDNQLQVAKVNLAAQHSLKAPQSKGKSLQPSMALQCVYALSQGKECGQMERCRQCKIRQAITTTLKSRSGLDSFEAQIGPSSIPSNSASTFLVSTAYLEPNDMVFLVLQDITSLKETQLHLQESLIERETLIKELYHRTRNNMNVVAAMVELEFSDDASPLILHKVNSIATRIHAMALVHDMLYQSKNLSRISLDQYLRKLAVKIQSSFGRRQKNIELKLSLQPGIFMLIDLAVPCGLVINELLNNCYEHAFPEKRTGIIYLSCRHSGHDQVSLSVSDTGVGMPIHESQKLKSGIGLTTVRSIVEHQLRGRFAMESSQQGVRVAVDLPLDIYSERV